MVLAPRVPRSWMHGCPVRKDAASTLAGVLGKFTLGDRQCVPVQKAVVLKQPDLLSNPAVSLSSSATLGRLLNHSEHKARPRESTGK